MPKDIPDYLPIATITTENSFIRTFYFDYQLNSKPGQFIMLWLPELDQKPFSVSYDDGEKFGLTIFKRGPLTEKMFNLKVGDNVGISGPYGTSFSIKPDTCYIMAAGGYGAAPLANLAEQVVKLGSKVVFCMGARNKDLLLFEERLSKISNATVHIVTDDGSKGQKRLVTDELERLLSTTLSNHLIKNGVDDHSLSFQGWGWRRLMVATCGPELMQKKALDLCNKYDIDCEVSIERYMKCGIGVCGQCAVDPIGLCMCVDGPVVSREVANQIEEFGKYYRDKSGKKIYF